MAAAYWIAGFPTCLLSLHNTCQYVGLCLCVLHCCAACLQSAAMLVSYVCVAGCDVYIQYVWQSLSLPHYQSNRKPRRPCRMVHIQSCWCTSTSNLSQNFVGCTSSSTHAPLAPNCVSACRSSLALRRACYHSSGWLVQRYRGIIIPGVAAG